MGTFQCGFTEKNTIICYDANGFPADFCKTCHKCFSVIRFEFFKVGAVYNSCNHFVDIKGCAVAFCQDTQQFIWVIHRLIKACIH